MTLSYTDEKIISPDGIACAVLHTDKLDFTHAAKGRKAAETLVRCAQGGEPIITRNTEGKIENQYTAKTGDAIFINLHNHNDIYVPGNADGSRWQFSELTAKGYIITGDDVETVACALKTAPNPKSCTRRSSNPPASAMPGAQACTNTCLKARH